MNIRRGVVGRWVEEKGEEMRGGGSRWQWESQEEEEEDGELCKG